jgi:hypothetical protein
MRSVCEKSTFLTLCLAKGAVNVYTIKFGLTFFLNYSCIPSPTMSPNNREYTVVPRIPLESTKGPNDEKCLGPTNPLIWHWADRVLSTHVRDKKQDRVLVAKRRIHLWDLGVHLSTLKWILKKGVWGCRLIHRGQNRVQRPCEHDNKT